MKIAVAQINSIVGDIPGNTEKILRTIRMANDQNIDVVVFPELALTGYPPEDLLLKPAFIRDAMAALRSLSRQIDDVEAWMGFTDMRNGRLFNAAAWISRKSIRHIYCKQFLPNYGVFDEVRYFKPGSGYVVRPTQGIRLGLTICEDIWVGQNELLRLKKLKPDIIINIAASPFHAGKILMRHQVAQKAARICQAPVIYCNLVGGQDELVFDGGSFCCDKKGEIYGQAPLFQEGLFGFNVEKINQKMVVKALFPSSAPLTALDEIYQALVLGTRDYVAKNSFDKVAIGLSGGIDSALVAAIAVEALGKNRVVGVTMPSRYNQAVTIRDAERLAANLGIRLLNIPIQNIYETALKSLEVPFAGLPANTAEENLQARIRGTILMTLSNKFHWLVLTTGNKSETSTGYCTLYGDTAGGFAVLKDVLKTTVYDLSRFINRRANTDLIPGTIINRPPSAELKENQRDEDSLGPYKDLDPLIVGYVENNLSAEQLNRKYPGKKEYVRRILSLIDQNEYKRRQAPPGIKISPRSFGRDHRMPITNRYRPH